MKILLSILSFLLSTVLFAQLEQVFIEEYIPSGLASVQPDGTTTYRLYASFGSATDQLAAAFATPECHSLHVSTTTSFFNDEFSNLLGSHQNLAFFQFFPFFELDSWVTIGADNSSVQGAETVYTATLEVPDPFMASFGAFAQGENLQLSNGAWFAGPEALCSFPVGPDNRVLLGQFTTTGSLSFALNLTVYLNGDIDNGRVDYVWSPDCIGQPNSTGFEQYFPGLIYNGNCNDETACNYMPGSADNAGCEFISGCLDPNFCDYNPNACIDAGCSPNIDGCTNSLALNFDPSATCHTPCVFELSGKIFHDSNVNGILDEGEIGIPNQTISLSGYNNLVLFSDQSGDFSVQIDEGSTNVNVEGTEAFPFITSLQFPLPITQDLLSQPLNIGMSFETPFFNISADIIPLFGGVLCASYTPLIIGVETNSNVPLDFNFELTFDSNIIIPNSPAQFDSIVGNTAYGSLSQSYWLSNFPYVILVMAPTGNIVENTLTPLEVKIFGFYEDVQVAYGESQIESTVLCSYDPNDIAVTPSGWEEPRYVAPDDTLEYRIRFQNTGNYQAFNVVVRDTISEHLDLSTFQLKAYSHVVEPVINLDTREIVFHFNDINLPYEECCELESHGFVVYEIQPYPELTHNTVIENTAYIYFDFNEPIVTNTAVSSIYICPENLAEFTADAESLCLGSALNVEATQPWIETYSWTANNLPNGAEQLNSIDFTEAGLYTIHLMASNPFCSHSSAVDVEVLPLPTASFESNSNILSASNAASYQWFNNGILIEGATNQTLEITEDGNYSVEATGDNGCVAMSDEVFVAYVGINEQWKENLSVFPIPVSKNDVLNIAGVNLAVINSIRIIDSTGKLVFEAANGMRQIPIGDWASGTYTLYISVQNEIVTKKFVVK